MTTNREKVWELRRVYPKMRAIMIAEELGITRERVRQLLVDLGLEANIKDAPVRRPLSISRRGRGEREPRPMNLPKSMEIGAESSSLPTTCPKCKARFLYREEYHGNWELKCFACGFIVAFGRV